MHALDSEAVCSVLMSECNVMNNGLPGNYCCCRERSQPLPAQYCRVLRLVALVSFPQSTKDCRSISVFTERAGTKINPWMLYNGVGISQTR